MVNEDGYMQDDEGKIVKPQQKEEECKEEVSKEKEVCLCNGLV